MVYMYTVTKGTVLFKEFINESVITDRNRIILGHNLTVTCTLLGEEEKIYVLHGTRAVYPFRHHTLFAFKQQKRF